MKNFFPEKNCKYIVSKCNSHHRWLIGSPSGICGISQCGSPVVDCTKYANIDEMEVERVVELTEEGIVELSRDGMGYMTHEWILYKKGKKKRENGGEKKVR